MAGQSPDADYKLIDAQSCHLDTLADVLADMQAACFEQAWGREAFAKLLALPGHQAWVLMTQDDEPLAYALLQVICGEVELLSIAVLPGFQGQGWGKRTLHQTLHRCCGLDISKIILDVAADNKAAIGLYKQFGFKQVGLRKKYYHRSEGLRVDALVMALEDMHDFAD